MLGFQSIAQLRRIYGQEQAAVLASMPSTKLVLRVDEPETAAFLARQIGERETLHEELGMSAGQDDHRFSIHPARRTEAVVMAAEIQRLPKLEGYLCIAGLDRARVRIKPCPPQRRQREFIPRALRQPATAAAAANSGVRPAVGRSVNPPDGIAPGRPVRIQD